MSKKIKLILMAVTLLFSALAAWGATVYYAPDNTPNKMEQGQLIFSLEGCTTLSWQQKGGQVITFDISGEDWILDRDESYSLNNIYRNDILNQLTELHSRKVISDPGDLSQYGLNDPLLTIRTDKATIRIGDTTAVGGMRYLCLEGQDKVYLVNDVVLFPFTYSLEKMLRLPTMPQMGNTIGLTLTLEGSTRTLTRDEGGLWQLEGQPLSQENSQAVQSALNRLRFTGCANVFPEDLSRYGPEAHWEFTLADGTVFTLWTGEITPEGMYAAIDDPRLYYITSTLFDILLSL